jgi:hypothetical protein
VNNAGHQNVTPLQQRKPPLKKALHSFLKTSVALGYQKNGLWQKRFKADYKMG